MNELHSAQLNLAITNMQIHEKLENYDFKYGQRTLATLKLSKKV